jgi:hypothetical protein
MMARSSSGYMKAALGVVMMVIVALVINNLSKKADINDYAKYKAGVENNKKLNPFSEPQKDSVGKLIAGFWVSDRVADSINPAIFDRIEIKDNGIVWRVITYKFPQDSIDTAVFTHAYTSYLRAFASNKDNPSLLTLDNKMLQQVFAGYDTCYANPTPDSTWIMQFTEKGIESGGKLYTAFDTTDLSRFFPQGAVKMVNDINIVQCKNGVPPTNFRDLSILQTTSLQTEKEQQ